MIQGQGSAMAKEERIKKLDSFYITLNNLSEQLGYEINRMDNIAIRFRGHTPKSENESKEMVKPAHKIDELESLANKIDRQVRQLGSLISEVEDI